MTCLRTNGEGTALGECGSGDRGGLARARLVREFIPSLALSRSCCSHSDSRVVSALCRVGLILPLRMSPLSCESRASASCGAVLLPAAASGDSTPLTAGPLLLLLLDLGASTLGSFGAAGAAGAEDEVLRAASGFLWYSSACITAPAECVARG